MIKSARRIAAAAFGMSATGAVIQTALGRDAGRFGLPDMTMPILTATLATQAKPGRTRDAATVALLAGTAGDMSGTLQWKVAWFGIGHAAYITAFTNKRSWRRWWPLGAVIVAAGIWATAKAERLRPACTIYACLVAALVITATGHSRLAGLSAGMFALSDFLIAIGTWRSKKQPAWGQALVVCTYLLAQAGLTTAIIKGEA